MHNFIRYCLIISIASSLVSVFVSGVFLGIACLAWLFGCLRGRRLKLDWPGYYPFVVLFMAAVLVAIVFSPDVAESLRYTKKFIHFFAILFVFTYFTRVQVRQTTLIVIGLGVISAGFGIFQYFYQHKVSLLGRITGFMSHWMTFSGQLMICALLLAAYLLTFTWRTAWRKDGRLSAFGRQLEWIWIPGLLVILFVLVLTMTRNAWVGCLAGLLVLAALRSYKLVLAGLAVALIAGWMLPGRFNERLHSSFDPNDTTNRVRMELLRTGANCIRTHPWVGIGPRMIKRDYPAYRVTQEFPGWAYQHLHNDVVQIAAEMGIVALLAWLAIWVKLAWDLVSFLRRASSAGDRMLFWTSAAGLAVVVGFLAAGLFEYNFGDSEVLSLVLFTVTAPYICFRDRASDV